MNYRQLQLAVQLSREGNFSQLAEKLNISQPALSKQILSLERELGVELFNRNTSPLTLTLAGEYFIREAEDLIFKEDRLIRSMEQFKSGEIGEIKIGVTPFRSSYLLPKAIKKFRLKYPNIRVKLCEAGSEALRQDMTEGKYDFAVINLPVDESVLNVIPMESDSLALVVPDRIIKEHPELEGKTEISFKECKDLPFIVVSAVQEMRQLFEGLCRENDLYPKIAVEVISLTTAWAMASSGVAATVLPLQFVDYEAGDEKVSVFKITDATYPRQPAVVTKKGQYISKYCEYAIKLLTVNS